MLLYAHTTTPRLQYVMHFLARYYGITVNTTQDKAFYAASPDTCKINYSTQPIAENEVWIQPHALLFEKDIKPVLIDCFSCNGHIAFFKTGGAFPFDLLAAVFYLLSRYEEYLPHQKDLYGRYAHENAIAFQHHFLKTPLVNCWLEDFRTVLRSKDPSFAPAGSAFSFRPTYDIDIAWSFKAKGFKRTAGGLLRAIISGRWDVAKERVQVLQGTKTDPFDAYAWLKKQHEKYGLEPRYFFLVAQQRSRYDKNSSQRNIHFQNLIAGTAAQNHIGLHPSWQSGDDPALLQTEKQFLETHAHQQITASRQHYIRFTLPQTFRLLMAGGITNDYSMGYGSINGFRASVATPFYWYDLEREVETRLLLHPFCFMDANAYYEQQQTPDETAAELNHYYEVVKKVNGTLYTIWHNDFLGTDKAFHGWRERYEAFMAQCSAPLP